METHLIDYLGKTYRTTIYKPLTDDEYREVVAGIMSKPPMGDVVAQIHALGEGGVRIDKIYNYFFKDLAYKTKLLYNNWSIEEALGHKPLMEFFAGKVEENKNVFPDDLPLWKKIETAFRLCGFKTCSKPSNFPMETIDFLLGKYCGLFGNYYDFACGWGVRLLSSLKCGANYFGTDPNDQLVPRLNEVGGLYQKVNGGFGTYDIRCAGSEVFVPEWEGRMDFIFSSPPYFNLEDYRIGAGQSWHEGVTYSEWLDHYVRPTIANCRKYLKSDGFFGFNIKNNFNYIQYDMEKDWMDISLANGFELVATESLENITRVSGHRHEDSENTMFVHENDESIWIFRGKKQ